MLGGFSSTASLGHATKRRKIDNLSFSVANINRHFSVHIEGRKKVCVQCNRVGRKTPKGRSVETSFQCLQGSIPLCKTCFNAFHMYNDWRFLLHSSPHHRTKYQVSYKASGIPTPGTKCICIFAQLVWFLFGIFSFELSWPLCRVCLAAVWSSFSSVSLAYISTCFPWFWHLDLIFFGINWLPFIFFWIWIKIVWKSLDFLVLQNDICMMRILHTSSKPQNIARFVHLVSVCCKRNLYQN